MDSGEHFIKNDMVGNVGHRILLFTQLLRSAYRIDTWCFGYDKEAKLFDASSKQKELFQTFFEISGGLDFIIGSQDIQRPVFFSDVLGCVWVGEWTGPETGQFANLLFVLGPVMYGVNTVRNLDHVLSSQRYSKNIRDALLTVLEDIPVIEPSTFMSLGVMLHCILTGEEISMADCVYQTEHTAGRIEAVDEEDARYPNYDQSSQAMEALIMRVVREGDVEGAQRYHGKKWLSPGGLHP